MCVRACVRVSVCACVLFTAARHFGTAISLILAVYMCISAVFVYGRIILFFFCCSSKGGRFSVCGWVRACMRVLCVCVHLCMLRNHSSLRFCYLIGFIRARVCVRVPVQVRACVPMRVRAGECVFACVWNEFRDVPPFILIPSATENKRFRESLDNARRTYRRTDGWMDPLTKMRGRI